VVDAGLVVVATNWLLYYSLVVHDGVSPILATIDRLSQTPGGRRILWVAAFFLAETIAIIWVDRPVADFFHKDGGALQPFFTTVQNFGLGYPWLVLSGLAFAALRWGGEWKRLKRWEAPMRAWAFIPGFIFCAVGAAGLMTDLLKIILGRTRPKLLFADGSYDFTWFGWRADHWSFPSGHAATAAALMTALWCLWPRPFWLYVAGAALVAVSRVITDQHYLSDVLAGAAIGVLVARGVALLMLPSRDARPSPIVEVAAPASPHAPDIA
jgi:membrane-associated phospholipid phosphatase